MTSASLDQVEDWRIDLEDAFFVNCTPDMARILQEMSQITITRAIVKQTDITKTLKKIKNAEETELHVRELVRNLRRHMTKASRATARGLLLLLLLLLRHTLLVQQAMVASSLPRALESRT